MNANFTSWIKVLLGPLVAFFILFFTDLNPGNPLVTRMAAIAAWMAIWWLSEAVPLAVTALIPVVAMPLMGIIDTKTIASQYMDSIIFLFIGGFIIAFAIERWNLHKRIALKILSVVGTKPSGILFGVMLTSFLTSMWISNTAAVMMLISSVLAVIYQLEQHSDGDIHVSRLSTAMLLGLAYSASVGGMATLVGTPTNMIFLREYTKAFPESSPMNFTTWFVIAFPIALVFLFITFLVLKLLFLKKVKNIRVGKSHFKSELLKLGKMSYEEKWIGLIFILTALLWFTRADIDLGSVRMPGWSNLFENAKYIEDGTVAIFMALLLFIIPSKSEKGKNLIGWEDIGKLPFDIILLFGGGFALAKGFEVSGLSTWMAEIANFDQSVSLPLLLVSLCAIIALISEFASNVACIQLMIPVLVAILPSTGLNPLLLLVPATLAASLGFMLPVATAPNTIVFSSKRLHVKDMMLAGFILDLIGILLIAFVISVLRPF